MKKLLSSFLFFFSIILSPIFAFDKSALDFSFTPKTAFRQQSVNVESFTGDFVEPNGTSLRNKKELPLPDKKLMRGFQRFQKLDAFGDVLPDNFLFYRENLTNDQKSAYDEIFKAVMNGEEKLNIITRIRSDELPVVVEAVYYDNPEPFWWSCSYSWYYNPSSQLVTSISFEYLFSKSEMAQKNKEFFNMSLPVLFYANLLENDMDKMKYVHDYLCLSIDYDTVAYNAGKVGGKLQTAYSAVVEYKTVCAGYSRAFAYYMQQLRIPCTVLHGSGHAWNLVEIDGECYQVDVTWDDEKKIPPYFNLTHAEMQKIQYHTPSNSAKAVIDSHPTRSERLKYANYFGNIPVGKPYTYKEFHNIASDIDNPLFAQVYTEPVR